MWKCGNDRSRNFVFVHLFRTRFLIPIIIGIHISTFSHFHILYCFHITFAVMNTFQRLPWVSTTNIYEVNVRQYTKEGTFRAFLKHLPRLKDMGVQTLWLMPITPIAKKNMKGTHGSYYACSDYTSINPEFGTMEDFRHLVQEAHKLGFKLIIDWVANHTGWDHRWT